LGSPRHGDGTEGTPRRGRIGVALSPPRGADAVRGGRGFPRFEAPGVWFPASSPGTRHAGCGRQREAAVGAVSALLARLNFYHVDVARKLSADRRAEMGQFLTPLPVARFMASMFSARPEPMQQAGVCGLGAMRRCATSARALSAARLPPSSSECVELPLVG